MRVGFTFDLRADYKALGLSDEETAEFDSEVTIEAIEAALRRLGCAVERIGNVRALTRRLAEGARWDFVFNICEGMKGIAREAQVPALLEAFDIPYTFADPLTLALALDKAMTKRIVAGAGVRTAPFAVLEHAQDAGDLRLPFPLFVKPLAEGSGKGVGPASRVADNFALIREAARLIARFHQPVLVETFLPGREFTVGILGTGARAEVLGVMEILPRPNAAAHGYGYENKEEFEDRFDYAPASDKEAEAAAEEALKAYRALRCRDAGRLDFRSDAEGRPHFLEANPLAGLNPERSDLVFIARFAGITFDELIARIVRSAKERFAP
ncbi:MAG: D-alanine--D-alanine ligase [Alphaproteobacteria bacterium]|nr:D-alanine--D-alanine ligase [Alphaproteobacteria bacterium]